MIFRLRLHPLPFSPKCAVESTSSTLTTPSLLFSPRSFALPSGHKSQSIHQLLYSRSRLSIQPRLAITSSFLSQAMTFSTSNANAGAAEQDPYEAFLNKANEPVGSDPSSKSASALSTNQQQDLAEAAELKSFLGPAVDGNEPLPERLVDVTKNVFYISDTDSEFEVVRWVLEGQEAASARTEIENAGGIVEPETFSKILHSRLPNHPSTECEKVSHNAFSKLPCAGAIFESIEQAIKEAETGEKTSELKESKAGSSPLSILRMEVDHSRVVYYVLGYLSEKKTLLGFRTVAVESSS